MKLTVGSLLLLCLIIIYTTPILAQVEPPMLPKPPEQAPLGSMGLLALALGGGAYAWKKLRGLSE